MNDADKKINGNHDGGLKKAECFNESDEMNGQIKKRETSR